MDNNDNKEILHKISLLFREINDIRRRLDAIEYEQMFNEQVTAGNYKSIADLNKRFHDIELSFIKNSLSNK